MPTRQEDFVLSYPFNSPTDIVTLRAPEWGNIDRYASNRLYSKSRGGTQLLFFDPNWPTENILTVTISGIRQSDKEALQDFLRLTLGLEIRIRDHEDVDWKAIIITPNNEFTSIGRCADNTETYAFSFEYFGEEQ